MKEEITKILTLLEEGKINKDQASHLIDALNQNQEDHKSPPDPGTEKPVGARKFHVRIQDEKKQSINLNLPVKWVQFGLKFMGNEDQFINMSGKSIPVDKNLLLEAIANPKFTGTLLDFDSDDTHILVEVI